MKKLHKDPATKTVNLETLRSAITIGDNKDAVAIARSLVTKGIGPEQIIIEGVTKAMEYLDQKCTLKEFCLLELMLAGRAAMDVIDFLFAEHFDQDNTLPSGLLMSEKKIVLGTIKGDIHEIGKNIVSMVMRSYGFGVVDVGKDVDPEDLVQAAIENKAGFIGVSSLITTTYSQVRRVKELALARGLRSLKVIAGGAALRQSDPDYLGVDYVADTPFDALHYMETF